MSLYKTKEALNLPSTAGGIEEMKNKEFGRYCDKRFARGNSITSVNIPGFLSRNQSDDIYLQLNQLQTIMREKGHLIARLRKKNVFSGRKGRSLSLLLDQISSSTQSVTETKNEDDDVEDNSESGEEGKWYKRPSVIISACAVAMILTIYLRYKLNN